MPRRSRRSRPTLVAGICTVLLTMAVPEALALDSRGAYSAAALAQAGDDSLVPASAPAVLLNGQAIDLLDLAGDGYEVVEVVLEVAGGVAYYGFAARPSELLGTSCDYLMLLATPSERTSNTVEAQGQFRVGSGCPKGPVGGGYAIGINLMRDDIGADSVRSAPRGVAYPNSKNVFLKSSDSRCVGRYVYYVKGAFGDPDNSGVNGPRATMNCT